MHPHALLPRCPARPSRAVLAGLLTVSALIVGTVAAPPASADTSTVSSKAELDARLRAAAVGVPATVRLGQDLTGADVSHDALAAPDGSAVTLDLNGHRLDVQQLTLGAGAELDLVDGTGTDGATGGFLQVGSPSSASASTATGIAISSGASLHVSGTRVSAYGSDTARSAGIGSPSNVTGDAGSLVLTDRAIVSGQGGKGGAGIGGAQGAAAISVSVLDSRLVGRGGLGGAGIGSGRSGVSFGGLTSTSSVITPGEEGDYAQHSSSIDASGGRGAAGIGGGLHASGGVVHLDGNTDANVSSNGAVTGASGDPSVVGAGQAPAAATGTFGALRIGRYAWLWANDADDALIVPADAEVDNDGAIRALGGVSGDGTIDNHGLISSTSYDSSGPDAGDPTARITVRRVTGHNYSLELQPNGGTPTASRLVRVLSAHVDVATLPSPTAPASGLSLMGWNTKADGTGEDLDAQSLEDLTGDESEDGLPVTLRLAARFGVTPHLTGDTMPTAVLGRAYDRPLPIAGEGITGYWIADHDADGAAIPALPAGLAYDARTGRVRGTPTETGTFRFRVVTSGRNPLDGTVGITVVGAPVISTAALPAGRQGTAYATQLSAAGVGPVEWSVRSGALPAGLSLSAAGSLSGTPSGSGTSTFTVRAVNDAGQTDRSLDLEVAAAPATTAPSPSPSPSAVTSGSPVEPPPSVSPAASAAPSASTPTGPAPAGSGTDAPPPAAPVLAGPKRVDARFGHRLVAAVSASSPTPVTYSTKGALPAGVVLDVRTGMISGVPAETGTFLVVVTATNPGGVSSTAIAIVIPAVRALIGLRPVPTTFTGTGPLPISVTGVKEGERFRVVVDGRTTRTGRVARSGVLRTSVRLAAAKHDAAHRIEVSVSRRVTDPATAASASFRITSLSTSKALTMLPDPRRGAQRIVVRRLAAGEDVAVTLRGRVVAQGRADARGLFTFTRRPSGRGAQVYLATGAAPQRRGTLTVQSSTR